MVDEPVNVELVIFELRAVTSVAIVVTIAVVKSDDGGVGRANGIIGVGCKSLVIPAAVDGIVNGDAVVVVAIVFNVDVIARRVVTVTLFTDVGTNGAYGYVGHGFAIGAPSIESNTYPINDPAVRPTLYDSVIMFPVASLSVAGTLDGANIIGRLPAKPFVIPNAAVNMNAGVSPAIIGCDLGAQHSNSSGISEIRIVDNKINCRRDHAYGTDAITWFVRKRGILRQLNFFHRLGIFL